MVRPLLRGNAPTHVDTNDLFALAHILPPVDQLHLARLRYLKRLLQFCPEGLWNMMHQAQSQPTSWLSLCQSSFAWFLQFYQIPGAPSDPHDLSAWLSYVALDCKWKGRLKAAAKGCLCFRQAVAEHNVWFKAFQTTFVAAGGVMPVSQLSNATTWVCDQCQKTFASKKALATHSGRAHGYRRVVKYFAVDNICNACAKIYHTRKRLIEHLRDATQCLATLQACFPPMSDAMVIALDEADHATTLELRAQGWGDRKALVPMRKIFGPCLPLPGSPDAAAMHAKWTIRHPDRGSAFDHLQGHAQAATEIPAPRIRFFSQDMPAFVFQSKEGMNSGDGRFSSQGLARETAILHIRTQVFVHFFSGYRRSGDLHQVLEQHVFPQGQQLFIISVDMCLQRERGDLASSSSLAWWLDRIKSGIVCGAGGAPHVSRILWQGCWTGGPPLFVLANGHMASPTYL